MFRGDIIGPLELFLCLDSLKKYKWLDINVSVSIELESKMWTKKSFLKEKSWKSNDPSMSSEDVILQLEKSF